MTPREAPRPGVVLELEAYEIAKTADTESTLPADADIESVRDTVMHGIQQCLMDKWDAARRTLLQSTS